MFAVDFHTLLYFFLLSICCKIKHQKLIQFMDGNHGFLLDVSSVF